ncbi:zinc-ribbon domain-containing protein [Candidatus Saccharibacteria bacterium]|nr:zinc-ribbon domain-containing protein [Candidatus Saccharibacteria bacterium]
MNCTNCGQPLDNGAAFCGNCGQQVAQAAVAPAAPNPVNQQMPQPTAPQPGPMPSQPAGGLPAYAIPAQQAQTKKPTLSLVFGILSLVLSIIPIFGLITATTAIVLSNKAKKLAPGSGLATAGLVLGIIGIVLSLAAWGYNIQDRANNSGASMNIIRSL